VVFTPGTYGGYGRRTEWSASGRSRAPITFTGAAGQARPTILGYNVVAASHVRLRNLVFQGPTGRVHPISSQYPTGEEVLLWFAGADDVLSGSDVGGGRWHAGIYVDGPGNVRLIGNFIHDNGDFSRPAQANVDHGIYWGSGRGGLIANNVISHNLANGIQLYPSGSGVTVEQNTIVGNGKSGVIVSGTTNHDTMVNNIVAENGDNSIRSFEPQGAHNLVENNLVWQNGNGNIGTEARGLRLLHNIAANPDFMGVTDFRILPCSPAVGRGLRSHPTLNYDIVGVSRSPRLDIGAYQSPNAPCLTPRNVGKRHR
jgi:parallel beta-helix repeat protein